MQAAIEAGLAVDEFAPAAYRFFNAHSNLFEEVAKFRAARRMWARIMRERFRASDPRSQQLRFITQTAGSTLTGQQPLNNVVRTTLEALAAVLGGTQSLHTNGYDEALALPTAEAATLALRTQQIIAYESGVAEVADPLGGSYYVEALTDSLEREAERLDRGDRRAWRRGGSDRARHRPAMDRRRGLGSAAGDRASRQVVVGVNRFTDDDQTRVPVFEADRHYRRSAGCCAAAHQSRARYGGR